MVLFDVKILFFFLFFWIITFNMKRFVNNYKVGYITVSKTK